MFGPLCLVFAGERPIVWASRCGKCGPNLLLQPPVEGCQTSLSCAGAGWGQDCSGWVDTIPVCTKIWLVCAGRSSWLSLWKYCNTLEGFGERTVSRAACGEEAQMLGVFLGGCFSFGQRRNGGWITSLCLLLLWACSADGAGDSSRAIFLFHLSGSTAAPIIDPNTCRIALTTLSRSLLSPQV